MPRRRVSRKLTGQNVPIDGERLKWALAERGLGQREAGREIVRRQWGVGAENQDAKSIGVCIGNIIQGQPTCTQDLRRFLSTLLDLPENWLSGELVRLPGAGYLIPARPGEDGPIPTRRQLAEYRYWRAVGPALQRDLRSVDNETAGWVSVFLYELIDPAKWRSRLLLWPEGSTRNDLLLALPHILRREKESDAESEARTHLVAAFRYILAPWIADRADLDTSGLDAIASIDQPMLRESNAPVDSGKAKRRGRR